MTFLQCWKETPGHNKKTVVCLWGSHYLSLANVGITDSDDCWERSPWGSPGCSLVLASTTLTDQSFSQLLVGTAGVKAALGRGTGTFGSPSAPEKTALLLH